MVDFIWLQKHNVTIYQQRSCRPTDKLPERRWPWTLWSLQAHLETSLRLEWEEKNLTKNKRQVNKKHLIFLLCWWLVLYRVPQNLTWTTLFWNAMVKGKKKRRKKTQTIHVIVNVVASDIPSVKNSKPLQRNADSSTAPAAVVGPMVVVCTARPLAPTHKKNLRFFGLVSCYR